MSLGEKATLPMFTIVGRKPRALRSWPRVNAVVRMRPLHLSEIEQEEDRCLEAMLHWHDPSERFRNLRHRSHTLLDDNPASG
jgi:hypothetical protein